PARARWPARSLNPGLPRATLPRWDRSCASLARHVAPEVLVQLDLKTHRQAVLENPVRELAGGKLLVTRREQYGASRRKPELAQLRATPLVIAAPADDELHQVLRSQARQLLVAIAVLLARIGCLDVDHLDDARIDAAELHSAARLERNAQARLTELGQQRLAALLGERLTT